MPFTSQQLKSIMATRGNAFVPRDKLPYAGRVAETWVRKKIYRLEDQAALAEFRLLQRAYQDIRQQGDTLAYQFHLERLTVDTDTRRWKDALSTYARQRLSQLSADVAYNAYAYATQAYQLGFYGRLWTLNESVNQPIHIKRLQGLRIGAKILGIHEADSVAYGVYGQSWEQKYRDVYSAAAGKINRQLNNAVVNGAIPQIALRAIGEPLGITSKPTGVKSAAYYQSQLETRTAVIRSGNQATVEAAQDNQQLMAGVMWLTAHDDRVCPICAPHDGQIFILNDLAGIALYGLPPDGTHYGCRCNMIPLILPAFLNNSNDPPQDTFDEWAMGNGLYTELDWLWDDTKLENSVA